MIRLNFYLFLFSLVNNHKLTKKYGIAQKIKFFEIKKVLEKLVNGRSQILRVLLRNLNWF